MVLVALAIVPVLVLLAVHTQRLLAKVIHMCASSRVTLAVVVILIVHHDVAIVVIVVVVVESSE